MIDSLVADLDTKKMEMENTQPNSEIDELHVEE